MDMPRIGTTAHANLWPSVADADAVEALVQRGQPVVPWPQPSTYLVCTQDRGTPVTAQRKFARRANRLVEIDSGHRPFLSQPEAVADLISGSSYRRTVEMRIDQIVRDANGSQITRGTFKHVHRIQGEHIARLDIEPAPAHHGETRRTPRPGRPPARRADPHSGWPASAARSCDAAR